MEIRLVMGWKMGGKGWNGLKMAGHLMVATIGFPGTVYNGPTSFWAEPELDSFFFGPKWECFEQQHYIVLC